MAEFGNGWCVSPWRVVTDDNGVFGYPQMFNAVTAQAMETVATLPPGGSQTMRFVLMRTYAMENDMTRYGHGWDGWDLAPRAWTVAAGNACFHTPQQFTLQTKITVVLTGYPGKMSEESLRLHSLRAGKPFPSLWSGSLSVASVRLESEVDLDRTLIGH
jgi:hypothetical protein